MNLKCRVCFLNKHNTENNTFKYHKHNCYEMVYFLSGSGKTIIGEKSYSVSEHTFCIVPPELEHIELIDGYGEIMFVGFECESTPYKLSQGVYHNEDISTYSLINDIFKEYKQQNTGFEIAANSLLQLFLLSVIRKDKALSNRCKDLNHIKEYIEQHYSQKINFRELSVLSGYSYDYFRHIFKQKFTISPQEYLIDVRLNKAAQMLLSTDLSCTEIAYSCGFSNGAQFSSMFKERFGMTPAAYRNNRLI